MNPNNELDRSRLLKAIENSTRVLRPFRDVRKRLVKDFAGSYYGQSSGMGKSDIIMNLMYQTAETYTMALAANRPRVLVTAQHSDVTWFAHSFQLGINNLIKEIRLEDILRKAVMDSFFTIGIVKVYTADAGMVQLEGEDAWVDPGKPFAENISLDDFCYDTTASEWRKSTFAMNKYRISKDKVLNDSAYDQDVIKDIEPVSQYPGWNADTGEVPVREMLKSETQEAGLEPMIDLMDIWIPKDNLIVTMPVGSNSKPVRVVEWEGPENGPFHTLSLTCEVPDNIMPVSPAMNLKPLHDIINGLLRKQRRQAQRQKDIPFYQAGHQDDARRIERANDGEWTRVDNPDSVNVMKMGGVDPQNQAFAFSMRDTYDRMAGNLQMMAGLGPQSETLGQDKLIHGAVSKREANMQYRVVDFTARICRDLGSLLWQDQVLEIPQDFESSGITVKADWTPEVREGDFIDYNFTIEPFSMMYKSPSERMQGISNFITQIALPMEGMMQQYGGTIDIQELVELYAELMDMPRLKQIVRFEEPKEDRPGPTPQQPAQASHTVRESVRRSVSTGGTDQSRSNVMQQILQGGQPNEQQMAQMGREKAIG
jgi:hypothetical protein